MRKLSKKISMLMVLAMLVSLFSGVVSASAASMWSFKSTNGKFDVAVKETIIMEKNEYADFDLYKEGEKVTKATYTAVWESSDPDVVWVDATNGRLRADKFGKAEAGDKAMISATFTNVETKKSATRSFYIEIAADPVVEEPEVDYKIAVNFGDEAFLAGDKYDLVGVVTADGVAIEADVVFSIDGKAIEGAYAPTEAGDVTIVATVTIDGEEYTASYDCVVKDKTVEIVAIEQNKLNEIRVIFNDAKFAAQSVAAAAEDIEATFELTFNADKDLKEGEDRVDHELYYAKQDGTNANCVYIGTYKKLGEGLKYKLEYKVNGKVVAYNWVIGTGTVPEKVEISKFDYVIDDYRAVEYTVKNDKGVIINCLTAEDGGFDEELYPIEWELVSEENDNYDFNTGDGEVYFLKDGAQATVKITIDKGYDEDGNELSDISDEAIIWGTDATDSGIRPHAYAIVPVVDVETATSPADSKFVSGTTEQIFFVGEGDTDAGFDPLLLFARYSIKNEAGDTKTYDIIRGESTDPDNTDVFTYQSSNTDIVSIDEENGQVHPVAPGKAKLYIKLDGKVIGYATVKVEKESKLVTFSVSVDHKKVSVVPEGDKLNYHGIWNQDATVKAEFKNQRGESLAGEAQLAVTYELGNTFKGQIDKTVKYEKGDNLSTLFTVTGGDAAKTYTPNFDAFTDSILDEGDTQSITVKVTAVWTCKDNTEIEKAGTATFTVKNVKNVKAKAPELKYTKSIDLNLAKVQGDPDDLSKRYGTLKLEQEDAAGFFVREIPFTAVYGDLDNDLYPKAVSNGAYTVVITKGDYAIDDASPNYSDKKVKVAPIVRKDACNTGDSCGEIYDVVIIPFIDGPSADEVVKADIGSYKIRLYKGNGTKAELVKPVTMKISDSTKPITIKKVSEYISDYSSIEDFVNAVEFYSEGNKIKKENLMGITTLEVDYDYDTDDSDRVYIYSITVLMPVKAYNAKWYAAGDEVTEVKIIVDKTFTLR